MTLMEAFALLPEPRTGPAQRHDLREMILMALCAVLCGANTRRRLPGRFWIGEETISSRSRTTKGRYACLQTC